MTLDLQTLLQGLWGFGWVAAASRLLHAFDPLCCLLRVSGTTAETEK